MTFRCISEIFRQNLKLFSGVAIGLIIGIILSVFSYRTSIDELTECYQVYKDYNIILPKCKYYLDK